MAGALGKVTMSGTGEARACLPLSPLSYVMTPEPEQCTDPEGELAHHSSSLPSR